MPSRILKRFFQAEPYAFPEASELKVELDEMEAPPDLETSFDPPEADAAPAPEPEAPPDPVENPISFAQIQADEILADARRQAEEILDTARRQAEAEAEEIRLQAAEDGRREGYANGLAQATEEGRKRQEEEAAALGASVQQFLDKAASTLDRQLDQNLDDLRDLSIAIAEKVVRISLKSSGDVISRMIQTAIEKRKRCEWVHIYIAECDAKRMAQIPTSLTTALSALSNRVRLIPMVGDEPGTCVIEMPDEIIDASAATQLDHIKNLLMDTPAGDSGFSMPPLIP
ncbi:MAG: F0F1 ATP synthase subunit delta [Oscillospiraceae bacterium]|nr:F0F1 ATP synthase subunit delta [Oscillospiraceae bacterium]